MADDVELLARCRAGDAAAFTQLYERHARRVRAYLVRSGFGLPDVDDLTQETFLGACRGLGGFDAQRGSFGGWLATIARNVARKHWARRPREALVDPELAEETLADPADPAAAPAAREELAALNSCVQSLPVELAMLVRLRYVDALSTRGIASQTGMAEATVRLRLDEARAALAACLKKKGFEA